MKTKTAIRQLIETNDELRHAMQIIQNFIENGFQDQASLKEAWNLISEYVTRSESLESVNEQQIKDFHIAAMKKGLINEDGTKWTDLYLPKITEIANQTFNETFEKP